MRAFSCPNCGQLVFFHNSACLHCGTEIGYDRSWATMRALGDEELGRCENAGRAGCNWLVRAGEPLCDSCLLTRTRPAEGDPDGLAAFAAAESAKRHLLFELDELGLPVESFRRREGGLAFDLLSSEAEPVTTGHGDGVITLDLAESDELHRTRMQQELSEPYRTVLGHLRHEIGHLSSIHDAGFTGLAEAAARCALELLADGPDGAVVDLGCGGGVSAALIAATGRPVLGIDISERQVELARRRVPGGEFRAGSFVDAELPVGCAAILAVGEIVNYAFDERAGIEALTSLAERAAVALAPRGVLLFDSAGPGRVPGGVPRQGFAQGEDWAVLHAASERSDRRQLVREITTFRRVDGTWRRDHETHVLPHLHEPARVGAALRQTGFEVGVRPGYDERQIIRGLDVFVARRPAR